MSSLISIRRRIKSAGNISQITKAMEMVAASKMRRAQDIATASRPYAEKLDQIINRLGARVKLYGHPLLAERPEVKKIAVLVVSTNRGLCGSLNTNLFRAVSRWHAELDNDPAVEFVTIGKKAGSFVGRQNSPLIAEFSSLPEYPTFESVRPVSTLLQKGFLDGTYDRVVVAYTRFLNTLSQETTIKDLLPTRAVSTDQVLVSRDYVFEPDPTSLLNWVLPYRFELMVYQTILDALASEHSARMVAMKNAHDSAEDLVSGLTVDYNRVRQSTVTNELLDVTTARVALGE